MAGEVTQSIRDSLINQYVEDNPELSVISDNLIQNLIQNYKNRNSPLTLGTAVPLLGIEHSLIADNEFRGVTKQNYDYLKNQGPVDFIDDKVSQGQHLKGFEQIGGVNFLSPEAAADKHWSPYYDIETEEGTIERKFNKQSKDEYINEMKYWETNFVAAKDVNVKLTNLEDNLVFNDSRGDQGFKNYNDFFFDIMTADGKGTKYQLLGNINMSGGLGKRWIGDYEESQGIEDLQGLQTTLENISTKEIISPTSINSNFYFRDKETNEQFKIKGGQGYIEFMENIGAK